MQQSLKLSNSNENKHPNSEERAVESSGSEESPKNLGKIRSLKKKMLHEHSVSYPYRIVRTNTI
jgi:hypothetical protein